MYSFQERGFCQVDCGEGLSPNCGSTGPTLMPIALGLGFGIGQTGEGNHSLPPLSTAPGAVCVPQALCSFPQGLHGHCQLQPLSQPCR